MDSLVNYAASASSALIALARAMPRSITVAKYLALLVALANLKSAPFAWHSA